MRLVVRMSQPGRGTIGKEVNGMQVCETIGFSAKEIRILLEQEGYDTVLVDDVTQDPKIGTLWRK